MAETFEEPSPESTERASEECPGQHAEESVEECPQEYAQKNPGQTSPEFSRQCFEDTLEETPRGYPPHDLSHRTGT